MRKETVIKFKKEFIAWCKGESVLKGSPMSMCNRDLYWEEVKDFADWKPLDTVYVLNDSYSTYRKALVEGKTVEVLHYTGYKELDKNPWRLFAIGVSTFDKPVENYRIKPEEPQFKVGDWVRDSRDDNLKQVINPNSPAALSDYIKWKPQPGEWCWFWNNDKQPFLAQLECAYDEEYITVQGLHGSLADLSDACFSFEYCEPFIGELPTHLKAN